MPERWRRKLEAFDDVQPDASRLRDRALHGPRLPDPAPNSARPVIAAVVAIALAVGSFGLLQRTFGENRTRPDGGTPSTPGPVGAAPVPANVCHVPEYDPDVAILGDRYDFDPDPAVGPREFPLDLLQAPGESATSITGPASDELLRFLDDEGRNAPNEGWRAIAGSSDEVIYAAPATGGYSDWWIVRFTARDGEWRFEHTELVEQHQTPAQLGRGLSLMWGETTVVDDGVWGSTLELANDRGTSWSSGEDGYEPWGVAHVFDRESGEEVGHAARTIGGWGFATTLASGETMRLPLSLGGALIALRPGQEYDVVACVPELGLASPVGTLRVAEHTLPSAKVLTYPFEGVAMEALGGGRLVIHNGCLAVESVSTDRRPTYVLWPDGTALVYRDGERPVLIDTVGREIAKLGDDVSLGGGYVPPETADRATIGGIPDSCQAGVDGYFLTGGTAG